MPPAGGDEWTGEGGGPPMRRGVDRSAAAAGVERRSRNRTTSMICSAVRIPEGQDLGAESGNRKRKAAVISGDSGSLVGNGEHLKLACVDSQSILKEIEDLRAELDEDVKELGYCVANQKLRVELALKAKEIQCLRKKNEEIQAKYDGMRKPNDELHNKNDGLRKQHEMLQAKNVSLTKRIEELEAKNDDQRKLGEELHAKNISLTKWNEDMQAKNGSLTKRNKELQARKVSLKKLNEELQAKNDSMRKWNKELQAKNNRLQKNIMEILENEIDTKRKHLLQFEELYSTIDFPIPQLDEGMRMLHKSSVEGHEGAGLTGCTDTGTKNSWDLESVPCLKQAEPTLCQAASSFDEIDRLQAQVTILETAFDQLIANRTPAETKAALKFAAYAADLERTREKIEELESEKAMMQQVQDVPDIDSDDTDLDTRICDLMVTGRKSKSSSKKNKEHRRDNKTKKKFSP